MRRLAWGLALAAAATIPAQGQAAPATRALFGRLVGGRAIVLVTLDGGQGLRARIMTGARVGLLDGLLRQGRPQP